MRTIRLFLLLQAVAFFVAALVHLGVLVRGYEDAGAYIPESIIGAVLLAGFGLTFVRPAWIRPIALVAQSFALIGALIGLYVGIIGVGPHTVPDLVFHVGIVLALLSGLVIAAGSAVTVVQMLIRAVFVLQLALGIAFWTGNLLVAVPFHMFSGVLFVVLLVVQVGLAAREHAPWLLVLASVGWALVVPVFGMSHAAILSGDLHWVSQVVHVLLGVVAIGLAERLATFARPRPGTASPVPQPAHAAPEPTRGAAA